MATSPAVVAIMVMIGCSTAKVSRPAPLPSGALTHWEIEGPAEIIGAVLSAPETLANRLPAGTRYLTLAQFVADDPGAVQHRDHLRNHPEHASWVVSFFEIVRQHRFSIDGRQPVWPEHGAAGAWMIPIVSDEPSFKDVGVHVLEVWISDASYAGYMTGKGHDAVFGAARLVEGGQTWTGSLEANGVSAHVTCKPYGDTTSPGSGAQVFFQPKPDPARLIRVSIAGHKHRKCTGAWKLSGDHVLGRSIMIGQPWFEFDYSLIGGVYAWSPSARLHPQTP
jgi:hypothetical protein